MKVIIAGSRHITDYEALTAFLEKTSWPIAEVVSGGCHGVDKMGEQWAEERGIPVKRFDADWAKYGREAGELRNREMAAYAEGLILLWDAKSPGASCMLRESAKAEIKIKHRVYGLDVDDMDAVEQSILEHVLSGKGRLVYAHDRWEWETAATDAPTVRQEAVQALIAQNFLEVETLTILRQPVSAQHSKLA